MENSHLDPREINHGLMVIDENEPLEDGYEILHFVGYWQAPTQSDADSLRAELAADEDYGLMDSAHRLTILPAPTSIVEEYRRLIVEMENSIEDTHI
jgi:hypothetical protein